MKRKNPVKATRHQKDLQAAAIMMQIFLGGLALNFNFNWHDLEEITQRAMFEYKSNIDEVKLPKQRLKRNEYNSK